MFLPYEILFQIATLLKNKSFTTFARTCRATAHLSNDEFLFKHWYCTRYKQMSEPTPGWIWKTMYITTHGMMNALKISIQNKRQVFSMRCFLYSVFERVDDREYARSCFGYDVKQIDVICGVTRPTHCAFTPHNLWLYPSCRKITLVVLNMENRTRELKLSIDSEISYIDNTIPPFDYVMFIHDGMCIWSTTECKYVVICDLEIIYLKFEKLVLKFKKQK